MEYLPQAEIPRRWAAGVRARRAREEVMTLRERARMAGKRLPGHGIPLLYLKSGDLVLNRRGWCSREIFVQVVRAEEQGLRPAPV